jgi:cytoskeletal protein CcmA (bactofilin family)
MFTNKAKGGETPMASLPEPLPRRTAPSRLMTSIIANGVKIKGSIEADDAELQVDGEIEGNVRGGSMTIGDTGLVRGDVVSESVLVNGRVEGSIRARKVQLAKNAHVQGDITHQSLAVEMGAVFEGQCRYLQDPLKSDAVQPTAQLNSPAQPTATTSSLTPPSSPSSGAEDERQEPRMVGGVIVTGATS